MWMVGDKRSFETPAVVAKSASIPRCVSYRVFASHISFWFAFSVVVNQDS